MKRLALLALLVLCVVGPAAVTASRAGSTAGGPVLAAGLADALRNARANETLEVVVVLRQQADLAQAQHGNNNNSGGNGDRGERVERALRETASSEQKPLRNLLERRRGEGLVTQVTPLWIFNGLIVKAHPKVIEELAKRPEVREIRLSSLIQAPAPPAAAASAPTEANLALINAPALWNLGYTGQGVVVANMDTGVDASHPDLAGSWRGGANSWYDPNGQHATPTDLNGHGTWTMGVIAGASTGVAPAAKWIAVKIFNDQGTATTPGVHQGFQWLLDPDGNPATHDAPNVVNDSWTMGAFGACSLEFQLDLQSLRAAGILPVFAAGNSGPGGPTDYSPANNPEALAVGNTDLSDTIDPSSSRGPSACTAAVYPQLSAPGVSILTTDLYASYARESGTSFAAPHAAGALALLLSAFPDLTADRQQAALQGGSVDLGPPGPDNDYGYGRLDVLGAYNWLQTAPDFTLGASPTSATILAGGSASYTLTTAATNGFTGDVQLALNGLTPAQASWSFTPASISGGSGTSTLALTTGAGLAVGTYPLTITATSGTITHRTNATLTIAPPPDFTLSATPSTVTTTAGGSAAYSTTVAALNGFNSDVSLSLSGLTAAQANWSFSPATISGAGSSTLTITTSPTIAPGSYPLTITASSGTTVHSATLTLAVSPPPDFTLATTPSSAATLAGGSVAYTLTTNALNGFTGNVSLTLNGLTTTQAFWSFTPATITGAGSSTLSITTAASLAPGSYPLTITASSGPTSHTTTATLTITPPPDFELSITPTTQTVTAGLNTSYSVTVNAIGSFTGSVSLSISSLPSQATGSYTPTAITPGKTSTLTIKTLRTTTKGTFTIKITGKNGTLTHQINATLTVRP